MENKKNVKTSTKKLPATTKKQKFVGFKEFIDAETGETIPMQLNQVEDRDFNFHKLWLQMFVNGLDEIANKKMKLAFWIIDHLNKENQLVYTFRRMAEETGLSIETVIKTMKALQNGDPPFLKKLQSGVYVVNPDILYKGSHKSRMGIIYQFGTIPTPKQAEKIAEMQEKTEDKTPSNAPESPETHEKTDAKENVPEEVKTPEMEEKMELPDFNDYFRTYPFLMQTAAKNRNSLFSQFIKQVPLFDDPSYSKNVREIFQTEINADFWAKAGDKLENLLPFYTESRHNKKD